MKIKINIKEILPRTLVKQKPKVEPNKKKYNRQKEKKVPEDTETKRQD